MEAWESPPIAHLFDPFLAAYWGTLHHVDHLSDFMRIEGELDDAGTEIVQAYINREAKRLEPVNHEMLDAGAEALDKFNAINVSETESQRYPNLSSCLELLDGLHDAVLPRRDADGRFSLTISDTQAWRDRMLPGLGQLSLLRYLWFADCLGFPAFDFDRLEALDSGAAGASS